MKFARIVAALAAPVLLTGCLLFPGKFASNVDLRKDGSFTVDYKGEVIFTSPTELMDRDQKPKAWADGMAVCFKSGRKEAEPWRVEDLKEVDFEKAKRVNLEEQEPAATQVKVDGAADAARAAGAAAAKAAEKVAEEMAADAAKAGAEGEEAESDPDTEERPCTKAEIAELRKDYEKEEKEKADRKRKEANEMATMFGLGGTDAKSNDKFAAWLMKHEGWKSVKYRGDGVFDIEYRLSGKMTHDYIFPIFPKSEIIVPFLLIRRRADGAVMISAPAFGGGGMRDMGERGRSFAESMKADLPKSPRTEGVFSVTTDGEVLTNNTADGPEKDAAGRKLSWDVGPNMDRTPETLIRIGR